MSIQEVSAEQLAELVHRYHTALAPDFGSSNESASGSWEEVPGNQRSRLIAAVRLALLDMSSRQDRTKDDDRRRYFARHGEAEWGC